MTRHLACLFSLLAMAACSTPTVPAEVDTKNGKMEYTFEYATTPEARDFGLMNRKQIGTDGMIFEFPKAEPEQFWMKNTIIPLDMLFLDAKHHVIFIATGKANDETPIGPDAPVISVIEMDGGRAQHDGIAVGDTVHYTLPTGITVQ